MFLSWLIGLLMGLVIGALIGAELSSVFAERREWAAEERAEKERDERRTG